MRGACVGLRDAASCQHGSEMAPPAHRACSRRRRRPMVTRRASARDRDGFCLCGNEWRSEQLARCRLRFVGAMQARVQSCDACKLSPMHVTPPITLSSFFETLTKMGRKMKDIESYCLQIFFLIPSPIQRRLHYNTASPYVVVIAACSTCHV